MKTLKAIFETLGQLLAWMKARNLGWMAPLLFFLLGLGGLLALAAAVPALSPFIYILF